MTAFLIRRYLLLGLFLTVLLFCRQDYSTPPSVGLGSFPPKIKAAPATEIRAVASEPGKDWGPKTVRTNRPLGQHANLHTHARRYTYIFEGKVACGQDPCGQQEVRVSLETPHNPDLEAAASAQADGRYRLEVSLVENLDEQMDWKLTARSGSDKYAELHGRHILRDSPVVIIEKDINLQ